MKEQTNYENQNVQKTGEISSGSMDIVQLILKDHKPLKNLIETLKDPQIERSDKATQFELFVIQLIAHAKAEEKSLYKKMSDIKELRLQSHEGKTEHVIAEELIHQINATPDDSHWNAKVKVLAELVEHHIQEEEDEILKSVEQQMDPESRQAVGILYTQIKTDLESLNPYYQSAQEQNFENTLN